MLNEYDKVSEVVNAIMDGKEVDKLEYIAAWNEILEQFEDDFNEYEQAFLDDDFDYLLRCESVANTVYSLVILKRYKDKKGWN